MNPGLSSYTKHLIFLSFFLLIVSCSKKIIEIPNEKPIADNSKPNLIIPDLSFPDSWKGIWKGTLEIYSGPKKIRDLPMELHILPIDSSDHFTWNIIYGGDKEEGLRPYELVSIDQEKGFYLIDEMNSIKIETYLIADKFTSVFEVSGSLIIVGIQKVEDKLIYEIIAGKSEPINITGDTNFQGEEIPAVKTYPLNTIQRAILRRY